MKTLSLLTFLLLAAIARAEPLTAAVFPFDASTKELQAQGIEAATLLQANLSASPNLIPVERAQVDTILGELGVGLSGLTDPATTAQAGKLLGAKILITGRLIATGKSHILVAKIISTETSRVFGVTALFDNLSAMPSATEDLAKKTDALITQHTADLIAKTPTRDDHIAALKKLVEGRTDLPVVRVAISEQHLGRPVLDPAAQTEIENILQQLGFRVLAKPDPSEAYFIEGEAFSEPSVRRGDLIGCRSRIEIKITKPGSSDLVLADRENTSAVDVAEHVAGKRALESGALNLLDRIVPKLASAK
ncbi:MAG TPA: CsgG/HfaB family protein [Chthoniobacterales bacterium]